MNRASRSVTKIQPRLDKALQAYAAAGAAALGLLASAKNTEAKVVFTPAHQILTGGQSLKLDINGDGVNDFTINNFYVTNFAGIHDTGGPFPSAGWVSVHPSQAPNQVIFGSYKSFRNFGAPLASGVKVGSSGQFVSGNLSMAYCFGSGGAVEGESGPWFGKKDRFLGLEFTVNGQTHFGWVRLSVKIQGKDLGCQFKTYVTGYAYETLPNTAIVTGKLHDAKSESLPGPALGELALGSAGLAAWRKEKED